MLLSQEMRSFQMLDLKAFKTARFSTGFSFPWCIKYMIISCANRSTQDDKNKKFTNNRDKWEGFVYTQTTVLWNYGIYCLQWICNSIPKGFKFMCLHELGLYFSFISYFIPTLFFSSFVCKEKMLKLVLKFSQSKQASSGNLQMEPQGPTCAHL